MNTPIFPVPKTRRPARRTQLGRVTFLVLAGLAAWVQRAPAAASENTGLRLTIFYTSGIQGTLEPCGCNSDPLGGLDRYATAVRAAQKRGPVLVVDGGNMLFPATGMAEAKQAAGKLKARFIADQLEALGLAGSALGPGDLVAGKNQVWPRRLAANGQGAQFRPGEIRKVGGIAVGLMGVVDVAAATASGIKVDDPLQAAEREAARLRAAGAQLLVLMAAVDRPAARKLARRTGVDFIVLGTPNEAGLDRADLVDKTFVVNAAAELQKAGRIDLVLRPRAGGGFEPLADAGSNETLAARRAQVASATETLGKQLALWRKEAGGDAGFIAAKQREYEALLVEQAALPRQWTPPAKGSYFTNSLIPMRRAIPQDKKVTAAIRTLDKAIGKLNLAAATPPPKAEPGRLHYVGDESCARCHKSEMKFWETTVHAHAWRTLVVGGKQADLECVGCHVTGYGQVGGASLGFTKKLESVQCEVCHGPGSQHVAEEGLDEPATVHTQVPEATCIQCHNEKHSDTFNYAAYLRDILGLGHGAKERQKLGAGPTGGQLRRAAMAKARAAGSAQFKGL